ncbi:MAG: hypothetical protein PSV16_11895 [Flavobacterium sp.]|nr:hypothetical protein [Flavobacterium sp.]
MKKKIILITSLVIIVSAVSLYFYMYKAHRDIASEKAEFALSVQQLQDDYAKSDTLFNKKYMDKTIEIYGKITTVDSAENGIVLDEKLSVTFNDSTKKDVAIGKSIKIKGRLLTYDDILEEFKMDQASIIK